MNALHFSYQGRRQYQEDSIFVDAANDIYAVCDGVGGSTGGAKASQYVIGLIRKNVKKLKSIASAQELESGLRDIHSKLLNKYNDIELGQSYGTTIAIVVINEGNAYVANIGDSKIVSISESRSWVSKDHSAVQELFDVGILTSEREMLNHPYRNRITSSISTTVQPQELLINTEHFLIPTSKIRFILASDGALEKWTNNVLTEHFSCAKENLISKWNLFKDMATLSDDNSSAILVY